MLHKNGALMTKTIAILDCDIIAFRASAANETRSIKATHKVTGQEIICPHRTSLKEQIKNIFTIDEFEIEDVQTAEEIRFAFHAMNTTIDALKASCKAESVELYISGKNNFRDNLELPSKYKGKREGVSIKPLQLSECREYLINKKGAIVVDEMEVDDMLAHRCYEGLQQGTKTVAATLDGDQQGVAGWYYNWTKMKEPFLVKGLGEMYLIKENKDFDGYGRAFFFAQWVLGDSVDCFKPCEIAGKKFGVVSMYNLLKDCKTDQEYVQAIYNQYKKWYPEPVTKYIDWQGIERSKTVVEIMDMYAHCCHMKRFEDDVFDTQKLLDKLKISY
jgi:hypothetical protein